MERQIKHRILGIFVIIGLVIILLPLFHTEHHKELLADSAVINTPPFPDQAIQVSEAESALETLPENPPPLLNTSSQSAENDNPQQEPKDIIRAVRPSVVTNTIQPNAATRNILDDEPAPLKGEAPKFAHLAKVTPIIQHHFTEEDGLIRLKNAAWVIQIGSFKNKTNALRLVNKLRASGYRAFIQQTTTAFGNNTRVFVGPEHKRILAHALANRLQSEMHIQGIVISYKPLTL